jgi:hypothetical protein
MNRINPDIDIIADLLKAVIKERPEDAFCKSLLQQYQERGGLSKKQLEGLLGKATKFTQAPPGKLATLEAIILKKHTNFKSAPAVSSVPEEKDDASLSLIEAILQKFPGHKRVLFFKMKMDNREVLGQADKDELQKFAKILLK